MLQTVRHARRVARPTPRAACSLFATLLAVLLLTPALPAAAQADNELPQAILEKDGAWNAEEARTVDAFIARNLEPFASESANAEEVAEAREALLEPLNDLRAGPPFQAQFFRALASALNQGLANFTKIGRINAMMLGSRVVEAAIVPVLEAGVTDPQPGVRYAASRSMLVVLTNEAMDLRAAEKARLIRKLGEAAGAEANGFVAGKLIDAIRAAEVPAEVEVLLAVFNDRVPLHAADPRLTYQPELTAMQELFIDVLGDGGFDRDAGRSFIQSAARYIRLTTAQVADGAIPEAEQQTAINLANQCYTVLDTLTPNAGQGGQRPGNPARLLPGNADRAVELAEQWPGFLAAAPLSLTDDELSIADPNAPATPDAPETPEPPAAPAAE